MQLGITHLRLAAAGGIALAGFMTRPEGARGAEPDASLAQRIGTYVSAQAAAGKVSGVVLLAQRGKTGYSGAFGKASVEYGVANTIDTAFNLGSIDKLM